MLGTLFRVENVWGSTRPSTFAKFTTSLFADFRVEIVPNSTHLQVYDLLFADFRVEIVPNTTHFQNCRCVRNVLS